MTSKLALFDGKNVQKRCNVCTGSRFFTPTGNPCSIAITGKYQLFMTFLKPLHHRKAIRLKGYDYSECGAYFVTICTQNQESFFGEIQNGEMILNDLGKIAEQCWQEIPEHYPNIELYELVIMPNHVHGILMIGETVGASIYGASKNI